MSVSSVSVSSGFQQDNKYDKSDYKNFINSSNNVGLLKMLAEVASQESYNEVTTNDKPLLPALNYELNKGKKRLACNVKANSSSESSNIIKKNPYNCQTAGRSSMRYNSVTADQIRSLSANQLVRLFTKLEGDEIKKTFYFQCLFLSSCQKKFYSFGSEEKARQLVLQHLNKHLQHLNSDSVVEIPQKDRISLNRKNSNTIKHLKNIIMPKSNTVNIINNRAIKDKQKKIVIEFKDGANHRLRKSDESRTKINQFCKKTNKNNRHKPVLIMETTLKKTGDMPFLSSNLSCPALPVSGTNSLNKMLTSKESNYSSNIDTTIKDHNYYRYSNTCTPDSNNIKNITIENMNDKTALSASNVPPDCIDSNPRIIYNETVVPNKNDVPNYNDVIKVESNMECIDNSHVLTHENETKNYEGNSIDFTSIHNGDNVSFDYLTTPVEQEVVVETDNTAVITSAVSSSIEFDYKIEDDSKNTPANNLEKKPKGKAKFIGQSAEEREMAVEMINTLKKVGGCLECRICRPKRVFTAATTLMSHYRSHAGIKPYECSVCNAAFTRQHSLNYHLLIHFNQTRFTCEDCGRKFRHPSHFKEHLRRHTGESPFQCPDCTLRFKTRNTYKRHLKTRHGKILIHSGAIVTVSSTNTTTSSVKPTVQSEDIKENKNYVKEEIKLPYQYNDSEINFLTNSNNVSKAVIITCNNNNNNDLDKENNSVTILNNKNNKSQDMALSQGMRPSLIRTGGSIKITKQKQIGNNRSNKSPIFLNIVPTLQQNPLHQLLQGENPSSSTRASAVLFLTTNNTNISNNNSNINCYGSNTVNHDNVIIENFNAVHLNSATGMAAVSNKE